MRESSYGSFWCAVGDGVPLHRGVNNARLGTKFADGNHLLFQSPIPIPCVMTLFSIEGLTVNHLRFRRLSGGSEGGLDILSLKGTA